jgi:hypothetical protein
MKLIPGLLLSSLLLGVFTVQTAKSQPELQSGKIIPVYPGAELKTNIEPDDSKICCSFIAKTGFDKVVSFYENSLKVKSLDVNGLAIQLPFMKQQADMMLQQMPPEMKIRFFVLKVVEFQGKKGAEIFEVVSTKDGVQFSLIESQMTNEDKHFATEWDKALETNPDGKGSNTYEPATAATQILIDAMPSSGPEGFKKGETEIYSNPSQVNIMYSKLKRKAKGGEDDDMDEVYQIRISITDQNGSLEFAEEMLKAGANNEKSVKVKGKYDGKEILNSNENGCQQSGKVFLVNKRFLVEITADLICDMSVINMLIDKMNLEGLPK